MDSFVSRCRKSISDSCCRVSADAQTGVWPSVLSNLPVDTAPASCTSLTIDTDNTSYHFWTFAVLNTADRALTHRLQSAVVEASGIVRLHDSRESYSLRPVKVGLL